MDVGLKAWPLRNMWGVTRPYDPSHWFPAREPPDAPSQEGPRAQHETRDDPAPSALRAPSRGPGPAPGRSAALPRRLGSWRAAAPEPALSQQGLGAGGLPDAAAGIPVVACRHRGAW